MDPPPMLTIEEFCDGVWEFGPSSNADDGPGSASPDPVVSLPGAGASANPGEGLTSASSGDGPGSPSPNPTEALHGASASANPGDESGSASPFLDHFAQAPSDGLLAYMESRHKKRRDLALDAEQYRVHSPKGARRENGSVC